MLGACRVKAKEFGEGEPKLEVTCTRPYGYEEGTESSWDEAAVQLLEYLSMEARAKGGSGWRLREGGKLFLGEDAWCGRCECASASGMGMHPLC